MTFPGKWPRRAWLATALVFTVSYMQNGLAALDHSTHSAIKNVVDFDQTTWKHLLAKGARPAAYVFTNSFCSTCPEVFELLQQSVQQNAQPTGQPVELAAILMDVRGERALAHAHHYAGVTSIYAFDGFEPAIRQAIDPKWRNITPYVVLVARNGKQQRVTGQPTLAQLKAWLN
ncbi:hypothetical protein [Candidatus Aalborgicola defluviihabitans]|uniref:hypothetical protein n=1 Tax=Candidatus Aalborgicola defluviihabitans TaxID=3386187 RepID=UPI001ED2961A|nr:hypothetical protein [Burkholderiales bacterium]